MKRADEIAIGLLKIDLPKGELWAKYESFFTKEFGGNAIFSSDIRSVDLVNSDVPKLNCEIICIGTYGEPHFGTITEWDQENCTFSFFLKWKEQHTRAYRFQWAQSNHLRVEIELRNWYDYESLAEYRKIETKGKSLDFKWYMKIHGRKYYNDRFCGHETMGRYLVADISTELKAPIIELRSSSI